MAVVESVFWATQQAALAASVRMIEDMAQSEAMAMIDPMSIETTHGDVRLSVG